MRRDPGQFGRRLVLEAPVETPDGAGGVIRTYQAAATVWAEATPVAAAPAVEGDDSAARAVWRIVIRRRTGVTTAHRLRWGDRILRIAALRDADGSGRFLELRAEEWVA